MRPRSSRRPRSRPDACPVRRFVANIAATNPADARRFDGDVLGLEVVMDLGRIVTFGNDATQTLQASVAPRKDAGLFNVLVHARATPSAR